MHALTIDVNVKGVINGIAAALPYLRATAHAQGRAHIITMCSAASIYGTPEHSTYSASKSAVRALTEALSLELAPESIIVSDVLPGYVDTDMVRRQPHPSALVQRVGVSHTTVDIAELIWASASGTRLHRFGNWSLNISDRLARALPGVTRRIIARMQ
jgi:short-subunit dehydrogenase